MLILFRLSDFALTGPVVEVVAVNFLELVLDESKDVLLEFYAPYCSHCRALE